MAFRVEVRPLIFKGPCIYHAMTGLVLGLELHTEDLDSVGDDINIFLFLDLSIADNSEYTTFTNRWDTMLYGSEITHTDNVYLLKKKRITPIIIW